MRLSKARDPHTDGGQRDTAGRRQVWRVTRVWGLQVSRSGRGEHSEKGVHAPGPGVLGRERDVALSTPVPGRGSDRRCPRESLLFSWNCWPRAWPAPRKARARCPVSPWVAGRAGAADTAFPLSGGHMPPGSPGPGSRTVRAGSGAPAASWGAWCRFAPLDTCESGLRGPRSQTAFCQVPNARARSRSLADSRGPAPSPGRGAPGGVAPQLQGGFQPQVRSAFESPRGMCRCD